jgi:hypothetical protein
MICRKFVFCNSGIRVCSRGISEVKSNCCCHPSSTSNLKISFLFSSSAPLLFKPTNFKSMERLMPVLPAVSLLHQIPTHSRKFLSAHSCILIRVEPRNRKELNRQVTKHFTRSEGVSVLTQECATSSLFSKSDCLPREHGYKCPLSSYVSIVVQTEEEFEVSNRAAFGVVNQHTFRTKFQHRSC